MNEQSQRDPKFSPAPSPPATIEAVAVRFVEGVADMLIEAGPSLQRLQEIKRIERQQQMEMHQRLEATLARVQDQIQQGFQRIAAIEAALLPVSRESTRTVEQLARISQQLGAITFNLDQIRTLDEKLAQKQQELVDDFIERRVTDHLLKEFQNIKYALGRYCKESNGTLREDVSATATAIGDFLSESGLKEIDPEVGAPFDPKEHYPARVVPCSDARMHGTISEIFTPGLSRGNRVIQQARVAVFKA
jgi:molecular chaperone GrpE (heat shock protein)